MSGISIKEVIERVGWSSQDTFCEHYYRPSEEVRVAADWTLSPESIYKHVQDMLMFAGALRSTIWNG